MNEVYTGGLGSYSIVCLATSVFSRCIQNYGGQKSSWRKSRRAGHGIFRTQWLILQL
ncbi:hypothetical protein L210DRAFT_3587040 [Boletus edulis BED1]|uniref:Uncharacterized protein n=1 Tax=Boletus edulis BED1 TaxID=1328754 RepID=A0AAD4BA34_BOLED|nr:hypothetical protein L210DRAFT_3587040 [Boletus edulis BED1]